MQKRIPESPALPADQVRGDNPWRVVVFSADCNEDGDCPNCGIDYGECPCYGPTQDDLEYGCINGVLMARKKQ